MKYWSYLVNLTESQTSMLPFIKSQLKIYFSLLNINSENVCSHSGYWTYRTKVEGEKNKLLTAKKKKSLLNDMDKDLDVCKG